MVAGRTIGSVDRGLGCCWPGRRFVQHLTGSGDEMAHPDRSFRRRLKTGQAFPLVAYFQTAVQMLPDVDLRLSITSPPGSGRDLQPVTIKGKGVVMAYHAGVLETEELLTAVVVWPGEVSHTGLSGCDPEAGVMFG